MLLSGLLVAMQFAAVLYLWMLYTPPILVRPFWPRYDEDFFHAFLAYGIWTSDASMIALWCGLGTQSWQRRGVLAVIAFCVLAFSFALFPKIQIRLGSFSAVVLAPAATTLGVALLFRWAGFRVRCQDIAKSAVDLKNSLQVSIRELVGFTAAVALLITTATMLGSVLRHVDGLRLNYEPLRNLYSHVRFGFVYAFPCMAVAILGLGNWRLIWRIFGATAVVAFALEVHGLDPIDLPVSLILVSGIVASILSVLTVRSCGFRFVT
jgi:hypothetical protein